MGDGFSHPVRIMLPVIRRSYDWPGRLLHIVGNGCFGSGAGRRGICKERKIIFVWILLHVLVLSVPPKSFELVLRQRDGDVLSTEGYTTEGIHRHHGYRLVRGSGSCRRRIVGYVRRRAVPIAHKQVAAAQHVNNSSRTIMQGHAPDDPRCVSNDIMRVIRNEFLREVDNLCQRCARLRIQLTVFPGRTAMRIGTERCSSVFREIHA